MCRVALASSRARPSRSSRPCIDQPLQVLVLLDTGREGELRQRGLQLLEPEGAPLGDGERGAHALGRMPPAARHLCRRLEVPLAVGAEARAHLVERRLVPQGREHVVHPAILRAGVVHVIRHDPRHAEPARRWE